MTYLWYSVCFACPVHCSSTISALERERFEAQRRFDQVVNEYATAKEVGDGLVSFRVFQLLCVLCLWCFFRFDEEH
mgnify:CR=1 FL=1